MAPIMKTASMKPEVALLDNDELNGVDNEADDWQVNNLKFQTKSGIFGVFRTFWHLMKPEVALLDNDELNGVDNEADDWQVHK